MTPEQWLTRRTYRGADFDAGRLAEEKARRRLTVSVCLPTLNVEATVGPIVESIRRHLVEEVPLVDELAVVDSRSRDDTVALARAAGARVIDDADVLPELGPGRGKGEALYKSLAALRGDLVVWIDSDIVDFDHHFVVGLLGPLLEVPEVGYVKALYDRRLGEDAGGGGRVTEICARPLLSLLYPELTGFAQPLAGDAAGRRDLLEQVPFLQGYAVEIGLLIDLLALAGLPALAQVDLGARTHVNQPTRALGVMATTIADAVLALRARGAAPEIAGDGALRRPQREDDGWTLERVPARVAERPPLLEVPGYHAARAS